MDELHDLQHGINLSSVAKKPYIVPLSYTIAQLISFNLDGPY